MPGRAGGGLRRAAAKAADAPALARGAGASTDEPHGAGVGAGREAGRSVASRLPRARVGDGGGEIETALTSSSRSDIFASLPDGVMAGVMAAETTDVGDGGSSSSAVGTIRRRFGACMITGAAGGGGSDDDAMSAFHGQCARQKRRSRKKYSASSVPQTRQPVKNGCAVPASAARSRGTAAPQALAPNLALNSLRRASLLTKDISRGKAQLAGPDARCPPIRRWSFRRVAFLAANEGPRGARLITAAL